jgi:hypothetical protein
MLAKQNVGYGIDSTGRRKENKERKKVAKKFLAFSRDIEQTVVFFPQGQWACLFPFLADNF